MKLSVDFSTNIFLVNLKLHFTFLLLYNYAIDTLQKGAKIILQKRIIRFGAETQQKIDQMENPFRRSF